MLRTWKTFGLVWAAVLGAVLVMSAPGSPAVSPLSADHGNQVTVDVEGTGITNVSFTVSGDCSGGLNLDSNDAPETATCGNGDATISANATSGFVVDTIQCTVVAGEDGATPGGQSDLDEDDVDGAVSIDMTDNEHWLCVFTFEEGGTSTPTATATGTPPTATGTPPTPTGTVTPQVSQVSVSVAPTTLTCNGSAFVTVVTRNAAGQVVAGGLVTLTTTLGTLTPTSATDTGAGVLAVLTASGNAGGTATITATAGGQSGTATATITCAQATAVPPTQVVQPQVPIQPPNTGDGGLAQAREWQAFGGLAMLGAALAGFTALAWTRIRN